MTDAQRLEREAQERYLATLLYATDPALDAPVCKARVEVTYQVTEDEPEHCGYLIVYVAEPLDPWTGAQQAACDWLAWRFPRAAYLSVDDIYAEP